MPQQRYLHGETRLLMDYLAATYPGRVWHTNMRIGPLDPHIPRDGLSDAEKKLMGQWRRYADAVVELDRELVVVETTIIRAVLKVGVLLDYLKLVPQTPELGAAAKLPVRGELVSPIPDSRAAELCADVGLRFVYFRWGGLEQFQAQYAQRFRNAPLTPQRQQFIE